MQVEIMTGDTSRTPKTCWEGSGLKPKIAIPKKPKLTPKRKPPKKRTLYNFPKPYRLNDIGYAAIFFDPTPSRHNSDLSSEKVFVSRQANRLNVGLKEDGGIHFKQRDITVEIF